MKKQPRKERWALEGRIKTKLTVPISKHLTRKPAPAWIQTTGWFALLGWTCRAGEVEVRPWGRPTLPTSVHWYHKTFLLLPPWLGVAFLAIKENRPQNSEHASARAWNWNRLEKLHVLHCFDFQPSASIKASFNTSSYSELDIRLWLTHSCLLSNACVFFCSVWMCQEFKQQTDHYL